LQFYPEPWNEHMDELIRMANGNRRAGLPRPEELNLRFSKDAIAQLEAIQSHYPDLKSCILPALWIAQREYGGHLPGEAIAEVAHRLQRSYAEVEGVATYYTMYATGHKPGKHIIEVCTCLSCQVCGAYRLLDVLREKLGVELGETTPDGLFTIEEVECLDACDRAPVLMVGDRYHGPLDSSMLDNLLADLRSQADSSAVRLADEVVKAHLRADESR
jgi:NADH-quinone oxidoreductase E subunit